VFDYGCSNLNMLVFLFVPVGLGAVLVHSDMMSHREEHEMLANKAACVSTLSGLNMKMGYFLSQNFFVGGAQQMREVTSNNFQLVEDEFGEECLRYVPILKYNCRFTPPLGKMTEISTKTAVNNMF
jgi:hypothetical protein